MQTLLLHTGLIIVQMHQSHDLDLYDSIRFKVSLDSGLKALKQLRSELQRLKKRTVVYQS